MSTLKSGSWVRFHLGRPRWERLCRSPVISPQRSTVAHVSHSNRAVVNNGPIVASPRGMLRQLLCAGILCALPALAQLPDQTTLKGIYNVRYLGVNTNPSDTPVGFSGTFTFDGAGNFTVT